jgi:type II restriction enzyme
MSDSSAAGNVGEWSELYTLAFLLVNGGAFAADANQSSIEDNFYKVLEIYLADKDPNEELIYKILSNEVEIHRPDGLITNIDRSEISAKLSDFFRDLAGAKESPTFPLSSGNELLKLLGKQTISASSAHKTSDLELSYEDHASKLASPRIGFSIKSQLGGASTLLNASGSTNFVFKVIKPVSLEGHDAPNLAKGAVRSNMRKLAELGYRFEFISIDSENFTNNLELIDSGMPGYLADVLLCSYISKFSKISEASEIAFPSDNPKSSQRIFKIKQLLGAVAMGLRPSGMWDGDVTKFKGLIVVKADGHVVFYYLYNLTDFQDFLYGSLKFEVASTTRHKFGELYSIGQEDFIKLNLQIRFSK